MTQYDLGAYLTLALGGLLGLVVAVFYPKVTFNVFRFDILTIGAIIGSIALLILAFLVYKDNHNKLTCSIGIAVGALMIISVTAVVPGILGIIGSIVALRRIVY